VGASDTGLRRVCEAKTGVVTGAGDSADRLPACRSPLAVRAPARPGTANRPARGAETGQSPAMPPRSLTVEEGWLSSLKSS